MTSNCQLMHQFKTNSQPLTASTWPYHACGELKNKDNQGCQDRGGSRHSSSLQTPFRGRFKGSLPKNVALKDQTTILRFKTCTLARNLSGAKEFDQNCCKNHNIRIFCNHISGRKQNLF